MSTPSLKYPLCALVIVLILALATDTFAQKPRERTGLEILVD